MKIRINKIIFILILFSSFSLFSCFTKKKNADLNEVKQYYYNGYYDRARLILDSLLILNQDNEDFIESVEVLLISADIDIKLSLYQRASTSLDNILLLDSSFVDTVLLRYQQIIDKLSSAGRYSEEINIAKKVFLLNKQSVNDEILLDVIKSFLFGNDTTQAINGLLYMYNYSKDELNSSILLSQIYFAQDNKEFSLDWIDTALLLPSPKRHEIIQEKAKILLKYAKDLLKDGNIRDALYRLSESAYLTNGTISAEASWIAGSLMVKIGKPSEASIYLERVLELERSSVLREKALRLLNTI